MHVFGGLLIPFILVWSERLVRLLVHERLIGNTVHFLHLFSLLVHIIIDRLVHRIILC